ncbi:MAG: pitrilysin family protein, partial [Opitutaceae bacterium]
AVFTGNPDYYKTSLRNIRSATPKLVLDTAREWLSDGQFVLTINPFPSFSSTQSDVDRSKLPVPDLKADAQFPRFERATLSNGLKIVLAERHSVPVVDMKLLVNSGYAADTLAVPGCARLALDMLDEGTPTRTSIQIGDELDSIGAKLGAGCNLDIAVVSLNTLKDQLDKALDIYADVILHPSFPESDFKRLQKQRLVGIQREKAEPNGLALRIMPGLLYGPNHPYGMPFTGSGSEASVSKLTTADMKRFHETWFKPNNSTLIVVGDTTLAEIAPKLEKLFSGWKQRAVPPIDIAQVKPPASPRVFILDRPGSQQSVIFVGEVAPPKANPEEIAIEIMNDILGGSFTSRVNMNLREDKHWSYGVFTTVVDARGQRPFLSLAPVQGDKTKEALQELQREFSDFVGAKPPTEEERIKTVKDRTLGLAGSWETSAAVSGSIAEIVRFGLSDDYFSSYAGKIEALKQDEIAKAAKTVVHPGELTWVVVGDRSKIEAGIRELNWGEVQLLDTDGKPVK